MIAAETRAGNTFVFQSLSQHIRRSLDEANKDNDFIYHAKIPETTSLPGIGKAVVAKIMPFSTPMSSNFSGRAVLFLPSLVLLSDTIVKWNSCARNIYQ